MNVSNPNGQFCEAARIAPGVRPFQVMLGDGSFRGAQTVHLELTNLTSNVITFTVQTGTLADGPNSVYTDVTGHVGKTLAPLGRYLLDLTGVSAPLISFLGVTGSGRIRLDGFTSGPSHLQDGTVMGAPLDQRWDNLHAPLGYVQLTTAVATAQSLADLTTVPPNVASAIVQFEGAVRYNLAAVAPTATTGLVGVANQIVELNSWQALSSFRVFAASATKVNVTWRGTDAGTRGTFNRPS